MLYDMLQYTLRAINARHVLVHQVALTIYIELMRKFLVKFFHKTFLGLIKFFVLSLKFLQFQFQANVDGDNL